MCFSATASFTASVVIAAVGVATFKKFHQPKERFLAIVPFLFSLQQLVEGFVWLGFTQQNYEQYQHFFSLCFLFFAWVVWPILIPFAFYKIEPLAKRKNQIHKLIFVGIACGLYATFNMFFKNPTPDIATFHIIYKVEKLYHHDWCFIPHQSAYFLATVLPMFLSSLKGSKLLAYSNLISLIIAFWLFQYALPSTWCFFAAFLSAIIYWILLQNRKMNTAANH